MRVSKSKFSILFLFTNFCYKTYPPLFFVSASNIVTDFNEISSTSSSPIILHVAVKLSYSVLRLYLKTLVETGSKNVNFTFHARIVRPHSNHVNFALATFILALEI